MWAGLFCWWQVNCFIRTKHLEMSFYQHRQTQHLIVVEIRNILPLQLVPSWLCPPPHLPPLEVIAWLFCQVRDGFPSQSHVSSVPITKHMCGLKPKVRGPYQALVHSLSRHSCIFWIKGEFFLFQFCEVFHFVQLLPRGSKKGLFPSSFQVRVTSCPALPWPEQMLRTQDSQC